MSNRTYHLGVLALATAMSIFGMAGSIKALPADSDSGISRTELGRLDLFLDSHPDIAQAFEKNPSLATNKDFVNDNPAWKAFLEDHPGIRTNLKTDSSAFMRAEDRFEAAEARADLAPKEAMRDRLGSFDSFLDQHPAIAKQLEANPSLIKDKAYVTAHPELETFLKDHSAIRENLQDNPQAFMRGIATVDAKDGDTPRKDEDTLSKGQLVTLHKFLEANPGVLKQLETNPDLVNKADFVKANPQLTAFLQAHPDLREDWREDPTLAMVQMNFPVPKPLPASEKQMTALDGFLDANSGIAKQLEAKPWLINNPDFLKDNPKLVAFLKNHPDIRADWRSEPALMMAELRHIDSLDAKASGTPTSSANGTTKPTMPPSKAPDQDDNESPKASQIAALDKFMDANTGVAKQLEANPSLIKNQDFLSKNSDLVAFLKDHPDLAEDWRQNPALTMTDLRRMDNLEQARSIGRDVDVRTAVQNFDNFLDNHPAITAELDHHPSLATNKGFVDAHPDLKTFLESHPGVVGELRNNPQSFMTLIGRYDKQETPRDEAREQKTKVAVTHK